MGIQFKKGVLELCLFCLISKNEYYAYQIVKALSNQFKISEGTLYPLLRQLTSDGFLEAYNKEISDGSIKKYYRLTTKGIKMKEQYVSEWNDLTSRINILIEEDNQND